MSVQAEIEAKSPYIIEKDVRCSSCGKLLTKVKFYVSLPDGKSYGDGSSISQIFQTIEVKIGLETKCNRCKHMNHELNVV